MALTNSQHDAIQREYDRRLILDRQGREDRIREAYARIPQLRAMEETLADLHMTRVRARMNGNAEQEKKAERQVKELREEREVLLRMAGYPKDYLELQYRCPLCRDTGYVDGESCGCRKKLVIELLYDQSAIRDNLKRENFDTFSFDYFDKNPKDTGTGLSDYDTMKRNVDISWEFIRHFGEEPRNLLFMGKAGTGKTFLTNCIARELLDRNYSVIYLSSSQLFETLAHQAFDREENGDNSDMGRYILECDLLIIDDLGTELNNSFVGTRLFHCINERVLRQKSTLISTNLGMNKLRENYTERVVSRFMGSYEILRFPDQDIRIRKKFQSMPQDPAQG